MHVGVFSVLWEMGLTKKPLKSSKAKFFPQKSVCMGPAELAHVYLRADFDPR